MFLCSKLKGLGAIHFAQRKVQLNEYETLLCKSIQMIYTRRSPCSRDAKVVVVAGTRCCSVSMDETEWAGSTCADAEMEP